MIVKRFGCTVVHINASFIHSFIQLSLGRHIREGVRKQPARYSVVGGKWTAVRRPLDDFSGPGGTRQRRPPDHSSP